MAYFKDLSDYLYFVREPMHLRAKNVGWLECGHTFDRQAPAQEVLDLLWEHCKISSIQTRGIHQYDFRSPRKTVYASRDDFTILLGTSEIRVFSATGMVYAAPSLLYHYVQTHHYRPPDEFLRALSEGPRPGSDAYAEAMSTAELEWKLAQNSKITGVSVRQEKFAGEMSQAPVPNSFYVEEG